MRTLKNKCEDFVHFYDKIPCARLGVKFIALFEKTTFIYEVVQKSHEAINIGLVVVAHFTLLTKYQKNMLHSKK